MSYLALKDTGEPEMGMIRVVTGGSFGESMKDFSAMQHGHAAAIAQAIEHLSKEVLPQAIRQDHDLHETGSKPEGPFGCPDKP
jgi:hypothetical protein